MAIKYQRMRKGQVSWLSPPGIVWSLNKLERLRIAAASPIGAMLVQRSCQEQ